MLRTGALIFSSPGVISSFFDCQLDGLSILTQLSSSENENGQEEGRQRGHFGGRLSSWSLGSLMPCARAISPSRARDSHWPPNESSSVGSRILAVELGASSTQLLEFSCFPRPGSIKLSEHLARRRARSQAAPRARVEAQCRSASRERRPFKRRARRAIPFNSVRHFTGSRAGICPELSLLELPRFEAASLVILNERPGGRDGTARESTRNNINSTTKELSISLLLDEKKRTNEEEFESVRVVFFRCRVSIARPQERKSRWERVAASCWLIN